MIGDYLEKFNFDYILGEALSQIPNNIDKRQGSIIYDALAPSCYRMAEMYMNLRNVYLHTFVSTSTGEYLDNRVAERGLERKKATFAQKIVHCTDSQGNPITVPLGSNLSVIVSDVVLTYTITSAHTEVGANTDGYYIATCDTGGSIGNLSSGLMLNVTRIPLLHKAEIISDYGNLAVDEESDEELRSRYYSYIKEISFGGNVAQYERELIEMPEVGSVQIYPTWDGGGTVCVSILGKDYLPVEQNIVDSIKELLDPAYLNVETQEYEYGTGLGLAPIGHNVTVKTPILHEIYVSAKFTLSSGFNMTYVLEEAENNIGEYLLTLKKNWGVRTGTGTYESTIFISRIISILLSIQGVINVSDVLINGQPTDYVTQNNAEIQGISIMGGVVDGSQFIG